MFASWTCNKLSTRSLTVWIISVDQTLGGIPGGFSFKCCICDYKFYNTEEY